MDFLRYFTGHEDKLLAELSNVRATLTHAGNKGQRAEQAFREFLSDHLPRSMEVGHGEAVDSEGGQVGAAGGEHQIDVLVISDAHPRFGKIEEPSTYFIEGVNAGGEVKSLLKLSHLDAAFKQAVSFKKLYQILGAGDMSFSNETDLRRFVCSRPYFLFAYEAEATLEAIVERVGRLQREQGVDDEHHFDAIFVLGQGGAVNLGDGKSSFVMNSEGQRMTGWGKTKEPTLLSFIAWLSVVMPSITKMSPVIGRYHFPHPPMPRSQNNNARTGE